MNDGLGTAPRSLDEWLTFVAAVQAAEPARLAARKAALERALERMESEVPAKLRAEVAERYTAALARVSARHGKLSETPE